MSASFHVHELGTSISPAGLEDMSELNTYLTGQGLPLEEIDHNITHILHNPDQKILVAQRSGKIVGAVTLTLKVSISERIGYIDDLIVHPEHRRKGIARALMDAVLDITDRQKLATVLASGSDRVEARALYEELGYAVSDRDMLIRLAQTK